MSFNSKIRLPRAPAFMAPLVFGFEDFLREDFLAFFLPGFFADFFAVFLAVFLTAFLTVFFVFLLAVFLTTFLAVFLAVRFTGFFAFDCAFLRGARMISCRH
jgi:hypothetical protein